MADQDDWIEDRIGDLEESYLQQIFACRTPDAVEAALTYAQYLASAGMNPERCPVFLCLLDTENRAVIDALVGKDDPATLFSAVQPNADMVRLVFRMLTRWKAGRTYDKNLSVVFGLLNTVYASPHDGYRLYPLRIAELNSLGKHLVKEQGQDDAGNRAILDCLDRLSELSSSDDPTRDSLALQATAIRIAFFDDRKSMDEVIPKVVMEASEDTVQVVPRKRKPLAKPKG